MAHNRVGDVLQTQGKLGEAHAAFGEYLAISRHLAEQDRSNAGWQRDLAVAHSRVGDVLEAQGKLEAADEAFGKNLAISRRLAEQDPSNAGWQRDLAVVHETGLAACCKRRENWRRLQKAFGNNLQSASAWPSRTPAMRFGSETWPWPTEGLATYYGRREN